MPILRYPMFHARLMGRRSDELYRQRVAAAAALMPGLPFPQTGPPTVHTQHFPKAVQH